MEGIALDVGNQGDAALLSMHGRKSNTVCRGSQPLVNPFGDANVAHLAHLAHANVAHLGMHPKAQIFTL